MFLPLMQYTNVGLILQNTIKQLKAKKGLSVKFQVRASMWWFYKEWEGIACSRP